MHIIHAINYLISRIDRHLGNKLGKKDPTLFQVEKLLAEKLMLVGVAEQSEKLPPVAPSSSNVGGQSVPPQGGQPLAPPQGGQPLPPPQGGQPLPPPQGGQPLPPPQGGQPLAPPQGGQPLPPPQGGQPLPPQAGQPLPGQPAALQPPQGQPAQQGLPLINPDLLLMPSSPAALLPPPPEGSLVQGMQNLSLDDPLSLPKPVVEKKDIRDFATSGAVDNKTDNMRLRLVGKSGGGLTWGGLMNSTFDDFIAHLKNDLKKEKLIDQKMIILARFKRQLILLCKKTQEVLAAREQAFLAKQDMSKITKSVDESLLTLVKLMVKEALQLTALTLELSATTYQISSYLPEITSKPKPGKTEALLMTCQETLEIFFAFCQSENAQRQLKTNYEPGSLVDVFPGVMRANAPLTMVDQRICQYVVENVFDEAMTHACTKLSLSYPSKLKGFSEITAHAKRQRLLESLRSFANASKQEDSDVKWDQLLTLPHTMKTEFDPLTPWGSWKPQRTAQLCQDLHTLLQPPSLMESPATGTKHRGCKL